LYPSCEHGLDRGLELALVGLLDSGQIADHDRVANCATSTSGPITVSRVGIFTRVA
jgi:hypothetical protein